MVQIQPGWLPGEEEPQKDPKGGNQEQQSRQGMETWGHPALPNGALQQQLPALG